MCIINMKVKKYRKRRNAGDTKGVGKTNKLNKK